MGNTRGTGFTGTTGGTGFFLDSINLPVSITNANQKNLIFASIQLSGINANNETPIAFTIMRSNEIMSGITLNTAINLATGATGDVYINTQNSSLWSFTQQNNINHVSNITVNMQAVDTFSNFTGSTGYYAVRAIIDSSGSIAVGCHNISIIAVQIQ